MFREICDLRVRESVGLVHSVRRGRESVFAFDPAPIEEARGYLDLVSEQWDEALARLKAFAEAPEPPDAD